MIVLVQAYDNQEEMNCNLKTIDIEAMKQGYMEMAQINSNLAQEDLDQNTIVDTYSKYENKFLK